MSEGIDVSDVAALLGDDAVRRMLVEALTETLSATGRPDLDSCSYSG